MILSNSSNYAYYAYNSYYKVDTHYYSDAVQSQYNHDSARKNKTPEHLSRAFGRK